MQQRRGGCGRGLCGPGPTPALGCRATGRGSFQCQQPLQPARRILANGQFSSLGVACYRHRCRGAYRKDPSALLPSPGGHQGPWAGFPRELQRIRHLRRRGLTARSERQAWRMHAAAGVRQYSGLPSPMSRRLPFRYPAKSLCSAGNQPELIRWAKGGTRHSFLFQAGTRVACPYDIVRPRLSRPEPSAHPSTLQNAGPVNLIGPTVRTASIHSTLSHAAGPRGPAKPGPALHGDWG